jgi:hypothetical protein
MPETRRHILLGLTLLLVAVVPAAFGLVWAAFYRWDACSTGDGVWNLVIVALAGFAAVRLVLTGIGALAGYPHRLSRAATACAVSLLLALIVIAIKPGMSDGHGYSCYRAVNGN